MPLTRKRNDMRFIFQDKMAKWYFILGIAIIVWILTLPGCKTPMPAIDVAFWAGDSAKDGVSRAQENKTMACSDPSFDDYTCLSYEDVKKIFALLQECQQWPSTMTLVKANVLMKRFTKKNPEVVQHVFAQKPPMEPVRN